ncbi:MAM and LDL-receptor class A domain-containing protein 2 [Melanotaenia boesemani]|uniref:MAM and LDL-receptor class A domain-containing protein 2 n=1 Tax=Melanotaenia boesemani TaxID=1250792 RepID=UPI001C051915|nr:MAM and LDL-receptor class A domain-containing protein 2 [Melanotaenia boesemani]
MKHFFVLLSVLLVIVSPCPDGEFNCTSGECVPAQFICDFKKDCKDGTDEEFCGSCDFEDHSCGWHDTSEPPYHWMWQLANITSTPGHDHTTGTPNGHVMHIDGKQGGGIFRKAILELSVDHLAALGCQISFWYHFNDETSSSSSSSLTVNMVRGTDERSLLEISKRKTNGWENATAFIGNQPGGYKLQFSYDPLFHDAKDVMLDDINFEYCGEEGIPDESDHLSCDFENDTCSWYHDYTASLLWKRTKSMFADIAGNGYFMLIQSAYNLNISSTARLISFPQPAGRVLCVSFWYHIFGNSIGSLKFITKLSGEPETVVWMRSGTQGNKWRFADLTFNNDKAIQFIIEAVIGGNQGSIAIDDIVVTSSVNGSCPAERECTFQGSLCGLLPQPSASFSWNRITGATQPANSSGPSMDHTLGTAQGYYLSAELWKHPVGSRGAMMTAEMEPTPSDGECLMFWYYMEGKEVGELSIYLQTADSHKTATKLWTRRGDQGTHWRHGRVTLISPDDRYQVIFEAMAGDGVKRDIAIDDLTVMNGACPPTGFCDFEMDFCFWVNSPPVESGVEWDWLSGESKGQFVPGRDHTTDSALGHFVFFNPSESSETKIARLESESMEAVDQACLEIWHFAQAWSSYRPSYITLTVFINEADELRPVWNTSGYTNSTWILDRVDYSASGPHQIILQAMLPASREGSFALDDVHIIRGMSCDNTNPNTTPSTPTTTTAAPPSAMDCTFEQGLCNWVQEGSNDSNWSLSNGLQVNGPWDGPQYDHSLGNNQGIFLLLNGSGSKDGEKAVISVPVIELGSQTCAEFWYYMLGPSVSSLDLLVQTKSSEVLLWTRQGTQNPEWINTQVTISINETLKIMFSGHRNIHSQGFIAIDDITVRQGACNNQNICGFDWDSCGFENGVDHIGRWSRRRGTKHHVDHTYGTENGFYMTVMTPSSAQSEIAELLTPEFTSAAEMCIRFWYWLSTDSSNTLSVHVLRSGELGNALWQRPGSPSTGWEVAEVTFSSPAKFYVVFKTIHVPGTNDTIKIDDVSVMDGACSPPGSCDFEFGQCIWVNIHREDGHEWVLAHGESHGPPTDHTTETPEGWFLLSSSLHLNHPSVAQVVSEWIHLKDVSSCLTLWYHMDNSDSGALRIFLRSGPSEEKLLFQTNSSSNSWNRFSQSIEMSKPFQLLIEAETNIRGFIAIDDISITPGLCQVNETSSGFVGCSFENGTCDWEDVSVGQFQWTRGRNATGNTGPSVDNTLGTELGWYMVVEADQGEQISPAALQSPIMKHSSTTCTIHFYYNMYGEDAKLNVLLKEGSRTTTLWWLSGSHGNLWQHGEVVLSRIPHDFAILFEASRNLNKPGHVAIDDVGFANCSLPEPQPSCPGSMLKCNNSVCVDPNLVCDFSDDCGDRSDENDCDKHGVVERCDFEQGLCFWEESDVDTPEAEWTRQKGQEVWPDYGPPRDHTQNSAAGHYVTPATHLTTKGQTSEILSKTLLPSFNCTVRFFYFSMDDAAGRLTAQSRTLTSGSGDRLLWLRETTQNYSWQRAEVMFSSSASSKVVFRYELEETNLHRGLVALDDISFSKECVFDPENSKLPDTSPTSPPSTSSETPSTSTAPVNPCQDGEFFCQQSAGKVCISATLQCDYHPDCPQGEDEVGCGPCTFETDQCQWTDTSDGQRMWQRQRASNKTEPPADHTTDTGFYMTVNISQESSLRNAKLQSPQLPPSSPYCQMLFHFHISPASTGSLRVLMQQAEGGEAILWSRSHNTVSHWTPEHLPLGQHQQPYKVWFSSINNATEEVTATGDHVVAVDDISFINCEKSYQPPAFPSFGCTFENGLCAWVQGAEDELDWLSRSGPTETPNTGPAGDHTTGKGKYLYINSSHPSVKGNTAMLKSSLLPHAGEKGYCFTFWYHMFGPTVGSLRMLLQTADPLERTMVWQKSGNQGDEWLVAQSHVTLQRVHQVVLEATVEGEAGDIAIDDISLIYGLCPSNDLCDFEEDSCNWQQETGDDFDWVRQSGHTLNPNTGPDSDHTTNTATGHYYYLPSSINDQTGQKASIYSPLYPEDKGSCVQLWYHMYGKGMGTLNVYQQGKDGKVAMIFSQTGDQGRLWRFAQASLLPRHHPYRIVVEGVKAGPTQEGDMAIDDVQLTDTRCLPHGICDFENSFCSWSNLGGGVDQGDWLRGSGASPNPNTGPTVDHTTNSTHGHYVYVDSSVGEWGDTSFLISDVFQPSFRGHCLTFWYHMFGDSVGTLKVYINDRKMHAGGDEEGLLKWIKSGNKGNMWQLASVRIKHEDAFWFVFVYQRGMNTGDVALDDITIYPTECPSIDPPDDKNTSSIGLIVGLTLLAGFVIVIFIFVLNWKHKNKNLPTIMSNEEMDRNFDFDLSNCRADATHEPESDFSFFNKLYDPSPQMDGDTLASSDA